MRYAMPWTRTYAEWNFGADGWYPTTTCLEPWVSYLRRIAKRIIHPTYGPLPALVTDK